MSLSSPTEAETVLLEGCKTGDMIAVMRALETPYPNSADPGCRGKVPSLPYYNALYHRFG